MPLHMTRSQTLTEALQTPNGARLNEKGGKQKELPVQHRLEECLDEYLGRTGLGEQPDAPLFPARRCRSGMFSDRPLGRDEASRMIKRRLRQAGLH
jgi:integrase/recombinase XerD